MARVTFSPLIVEMSGKVADAVFSRWKGIDYVRSRVTPANPQTALQTAQREALANTLTMWQSIKSWAKAIWDHYAEGYAWSGYNRYMDYHILLTKAGTAGKITPANPDYVKISAEAIAAGGAGEITCTWTNDTGVHDVEHVYFFYRKTETASEEYAWTSDGAHAIDEETHTITGLDTGEEYEVAMFAAIVNKSLCQEAFNKVLVAG